MSYPIMELDGIGAEMAAKLRKVGIRTSGKLLETAGTPKGRKDLAAKLDVDERHVLRWANLVDRMRIKGVGEPYAELLRAAGVDTVRELKHRNVENLAHAMAEANKKRKLVQMPPSEKRIRSWIAHAKELPLKIRY